MTEKNKNPPNMPKVNDRIRITHDKLVIETTIRFMAIYPNGVVIIHPDSEIVRELIFGDEKWEGQIYSEIEKLSELLTFTVEVI